MYPSIHWHAAVMCMELHVLAPLQRLLPCMAWQQSQADLVYPACIHTKQQHAGVDCLTHLRSHSD
jgi:hypothetical protein